MQAQRHIAAALGHTVRKRPAERMASSFRRGIAEAESAPQLDSASGAHRLNLVLIDQPRNWGRRLPRAASAVADFALGYRISPLQGLSIVRSLHQPEPITQA